ncbi:RNase P and RNase MRP subunit [Emydomyces testavorans]|uniref:RNase P and RNase MRP subunit n=1 Tax=Emydomyces testavorans TaxID=2070801 RepID=A0AAF0IHD3_9EURO|nr:RNase P and RNase MRP subunit [Emydomyces testavorans]
MGFNSTSRVLELMCKIPNDTSIDDSLPSGENVMAPEQVVLDQAKKASELAAVFVCRSTLPTALYAPIPLLITTASRALPPGKKPRLVYLPKGSELRLSKALGLPKVGIIGITDCSPALTLIEYVRQNVPPLDISNTPLS